MQPDKQPCGAKTRSGEPCRSPGMENGRCRMHGGKSLAGVAHPNFKDGSRSRYPLQGVLAEPYARHLADLDYISLRDELALTTTQIEEEALKLDSLRELPAEQFDEKERAERAGEIMYHQKRLAGLINERRKLAAVEAQRVKLAQETITGEQIQLFAAAVLEAVRRHVRAHEVVQAIQGEVLSIMRAAAAS